MNQYSSLNDLAKFEGEQQSKIIAAVRKMHAGLDAVKEASLFNQLTALLAPYQQC